MSLRQPVTTIALLASLAVGCADTDAANATTAGNELNGASSVPLTFQGTCEHLRACSMRSQNLPQGKVRWSCSGVDACFDDERWVAGPAKAYCNKRVIVCNGTECTNARVRDVSASREWEASSGVLDALGLQHATDTAACTTSGGGNVTIAATDGTPLLEKDPKGEEEVFAGCWSETRQRDVAELTCVQSNANQIWMQCKDGKWYRGVEGDRGPYGACVETIALGSEEQ